jgi:CRP/FNR family transcriptional regulator
MRDTTIVPCERCPVRRMALFRAFSPEELALIGGMKTGQLLADPETELLDHSEAGSALMTVFEGWAYRYRDDGPSRRQILEILLPGDLIGLDSVLLGGPAYPVRALTAVNVCVLDTTLVQRMVDEQPMLARALMARLSQDLRRGDERLWGQRSGPQRCAYFMLDIHDRLHSRGMVNGGGCPFPLQRRHLAAALGISGTHVARSLAELRDAGLATVANGALLIHDRPRLAALAGYTAVYQPGRAALF